MRRRTLLCLATGLLVVRPAIAAIFVTDSSTRVPELARGGPAAIAGVVFGTLPVENAGHRNQLVIPAGTAFMVSPCQAVTNFHVVFGVAKSGDVKHVMTMVIRGTQIYRVRATPVAWGDTSAIRDWALLRLDRCVGEDPLIGWGIGPAATEAGKVTIVALRGDRGLDSLWRADCTIYHSRHGLIAHDCPSVPGSSGAPLYALDDQGVPVIVGINVGGYGRSGDVIVKRYDNLYANVAVSFASLWPVLQFWISQDLQDHAVVNPQLLNHFARGSGATAGHH